MCGGDGDGVRTLWHRCAGPAGDHGEGSREKLLQQTGGWVVEGLEC